jgi:hypothetical protein
MAPLAETVANRAKRADRARNPAESGFDLKEIR